MTRRERNHRAIAWQEFRRRLGARKSAPIGASWNVWVAYNNWLEQGRKWFMGEEDGAERE